jgi:hypothetical protein
VSNCIIQKEISLLGGDYDKNQLLLSQSVKFCDFLSAPIAAFTIFVAD